MRIPDIHARYIKNMSCRTRYCAVCASSTQVTDRAYRAAHRATLGTAIAAALPAHVLPNARCSSGSERAHALQRHPPPAPQAPRRHSIRTTNGPPRGSPASPADRATLPIRPARSLPRALATERACCALLPRPDPCPLPSLHTAGSACPTCARNCCRSVKFVRTRRHARSLAC